MKGFKRFIDPEGSFTTDLMVAVLFGSDNQDAIKLVLDYLIRQFPNHLLSIRHHTKRNDALHDLGVHHLFGLPYLHERLGDLTYRIGPKSFFQTNSYQALHMFETISALAELDGSETVYDLYCGTGSIGLFLAGQCKACGWDRGDSGSH